MTLIPRIAMLATAALLVSAAPVSSANEDNRFCPNERDWILLPSVFVDKDRNVDGYVCMKLANPQAAKDNNNPPPRSENPDDYVDNEFPYVGDVS